MAGKTSYRVWSDLMAGNVLLHLTDLHFGGDWGQVELATRDAVLHSLIEKVAEQPPEWGPTCICISGDIGFKGSNNDYALAEIWLKTLLDSLKLTFDDLVVCPGNHDVHQPTALRLARPTGATEADQVLTLPIAKHLEEPFSAYSDFCRRVGIPAMAIGSQQTHLVGQRTHKGIRFVTVNSAWFSKDKHDKDKLWIGLPQLRYLDGTQELPVVSQSQLVPRTVCLLHHPPDWLHEEEKHAYERRPNAIDFLAHRCHLLLTGHTHGEVRRADRIAESAWHLTGGATFAGASHFNSFRLIRIEDHQFVYRSFEYDPRTAGVLWKEVLGANAVPFSVAPITAGTQPQIESVLDLRLLQNASRADAERTISLKSRQIKTHGSLPVVLQLQVSHRTTDQPLQYELHGRVVQEKHSDVRIPFTEACRRSRKTVLLGELGSGKSTLAAQLVVDTIAQSDGTVAFLVPAKALRLDGNFRIDELLVAVDQHLSGQIAPNSGEVRIKSLLKQSANITLVFDGLDELPSPLLPYFIRQIAQLTEHWPTIQLVATGRPIEMPGVNFDTWQVCMVPALGQSEKLELFTREGAADGLSRPTSLQRAHRLLRILKNHPALDALATTPLAVRLIHSKLDALDKESDATTLGDLLVELLSERLERWAERDLRESIYARFEQAVSTAEARASLLGALALECMSAAGPITEERARRTLQDRLCDHSGDQAQIATQALSFFNAMGLITVGESVEFIFQPLMQVSAGAALFDDWLAAPCDLSELDKLEWRVVSFAATLARRRGVMDAVRPTMVQCIERLLKTADGIAPACYIINECKDVTLAVGAVQRFASFGRRPLYWYPKEEAASTRAIALAIVLAGAPGFEWLFATYLDPRFPLLHRGSAVIEAVVRHWAAIIEGKLTPEQCAKLSELVAPFQAHPGMTDLLKTLVILVPASFKWDERLWHLSGMLSNSLFAEQAESAMRTAYDSEPSTVNALLCHRARDFKSASLYLALNITTPPIEILKSVVRASAARPGDATVDEAIQACRDRLGNKSWSALLRWFLSDRKPDEHVATGAALLLYDDGERRLEVLGESLLDGVHDGAYIPRAEEVLSTLIDARGKPALYWLAGHLRDLKARFMGAHSGVWRLFLKWISLAEDAGPRLLSECMGSVGPYLLPRYPEVRHEFRKILQDERFHAAFREQLGNLSPEVRFGCAAVLATNDPKSEAEATFVVIQRRPFTRRHMYHEWDSFFLKLRFSFSVLEYVQSKMKILNPASRTFALALLARHDAPLTVEERNELLEDLLELGNWSLAVESSFDPARPEARAVLLSQLRRQSNETAGRAADLLLEYHASSLSPEEEAFCWGTRSGRHSVVGMDIQMCRVADDSAFRSRIAEVSRTISQGTGKVPILGLVADAVSGHGEWKDVVWALLCDDSGIGADAEERGGVLFEFARRQTQFANAIGNAAKEILDDPRIQRERWTDLYHWTALIADEFAGLTSEKITEVLMVGAPISGEATRSLIARLGQCPSDLPMRERAGRMPAFPVVMPDSLSPAETRAQLQECCRHGENLHPNACMLIEQILIHPQLSDEELVSMALGGRCGILITQVLRFCYGRPSSLSDRVRLVREPFLTRQQAQDECLLRLVAVQNIAHTAFVSVDMPARAEYCRHLAAALPVSWTAPVATEILAVSQELPEQHIAKVFVDFAEHHGQWDNRLGEELAIWIASLQEDDGRRLTIISAAEQAIEVLDETSWQMHSSGLKDSAMPFLIFPLTLWIYTGATTEKCDRVFLRGIKFLFQETPAGVVGDTDPIVMIEPLLSLVPKKQLAKVLQKGIAFPDAPVRAFVAMILSLALSTHEVEPHTI
jgi:hypothetical protein